MVTADTSHAGPVGLSGMRKLCPRSSTPLVAAAENAVVKVSRCPSGPGVAVVNVVCGLATTAPVGSSVLTVSVAPLATPAGNNKPELSANDRRPLDCLIMLSP